MKVFLAGATGAMGRVLVPRLVAARHEVVGMTRSAEKQDAVRALGASPVLADALDPEQVAAAVAEAKPEVIVHELTAISGLDMRHFDRAYGPTNRLRTEGTDHLLAAGHAIGVRRIVAQSYTSWPYARTGGSVKDETDPLDPSPASAMRELFAAIRHLEEAVTGASWTEGIVLRYGMFYGPETSLAVGGEQFRARAQAEVPRRRKRRRGVSFVHIEDAAEATVVAIERGERGIYNVVDDEPAPVADWLPALADALGAPKPRRVPRFLGRMLAGEAAAVMMTEVRGASNAKAKRKLGWEPRHPTWRHGFAT